MFSEQVQALCTVIAHTVSHDNSASIEAGDFTNKFLELSDAERFNLFHFKKKHVLRMMPACDVSNMIHL